MAVLQECLLCHRKQSNKNKKCNHCGTDLDKFKKAGKAKYWIAYRINGKQRFESIGTDYAEAAASDGKRKSQVAENRVLEILKSDQTTFNELAEWYFRQPSVLRLKSLVRIRIAIDRFTGVFGDIPTTEIKRADIERYQDSRTNAGKAPATIDTEIRMIKTMVNAGFMGDVIDGSALKQFKTVKRLLRTGANARRRILKKSEYQAIIEVALPHIRDFVIIGLNTGMRLSEIQRLEWKNIDRDKRFIRMEAGETKEKMPKVIPINHHVRAVLDSQLRWVQHDRVITYIGKPIKSTAGAIVRGVRGAVKKAGVLYGRDTSGGFVFHDLRRTAKSLMLQAGVDPVHRNMILGHAQTGMDARYMVQGDDALFQAMETFTRFIDNGSW